MVFSPFESRASSEQCEVNTDNFFFDIRDTVHKELISASQQVTGKFYCDVLKRLRDSVRHKRDEM